MSRVQRSRATLAHRREVLSLEASALSVARRSWARVDPARISESWSAQLPQMASKLGAVQQRAAEAGASYGARVLAEASDYVAPRAFVDPVGFGGWVASVDGAEAVPMSRALYAPAIRAKNGISSGLSVRDALESAGRALDRLAVTAVSDASRQAAGVDVSARPHVGYVRQLVGDSCRECVVLAGRWYRWNAGFDRHPQDDCVHVPATREAAEARLSDPYEYFRSLSEAEQDEKWGRADAQAIRDGADMFRVENARRGVRGDHTTAGMSRRGFGRRELGLNQRLTPEGIYRVARDRDEALRLLEAHGYVHAGGQDPLGSILGQREGFGVLGRGGTRKGASAAVREARLTGVRQPGERATMTAGERRMFDAELRWRTVLEGRNPNGGELTDTVRATVEREYRGALRKAAADQSAALRGLYY